MMLLGAGAGIAALVGTGGIATPLVMGTSSLYAAGRGVTTLYDLNQHQQSLMYETLKPAVHI